MDLFTIAASICFLAIALGFGAAFKRLLSGNSSTPDSNDSDALFSAPRYRAVDRLLGTADQEFLASQGCWTPERAKSFRKTRIKIFRGYLRSLSSDFQRVLQEIRTHMIQSPADRTELAGIALQAHVRFSASLVAVEAKLILYGFGWRGADAAAIVRPLESLRVQMQYLAAVAAPAAA